MRAAGPTPSGTGNGKRPGRAGTGAFLIAEPWELRMSWERRLCCCPDFSNCGSHIWREVRGRGEAGPSPREASLSAGSDGRFSPSSLLSWWKTTCSQDGARIGWPLSEGAYLIYARMSSVWRPFPSPIAAISFSRELRRRIRRSFSRLRLYTCSRRTCPSGED